MNNENQLFQDPRHPLAAPQCTLISIVPFPIDEIKPGLIPGNYHVDASVDDEPVCSLVSDAIHYVYIDKDRGSMRVLNPSYQVARSIVHDYLQSQLEATPGCHPGIMWKLGEYTVERVKRELEGELLELRQIQFEWFKKLVAVADDDWEKMRSHHAISDTQRWAARKIDPTNSRNRPWLMPAALPQPVVDLQEMMTCPACGSDILQDVVICKYCQCIIDKDRYQEMAFGTTRPTVNLANILNKQGVTQ